MPGSAPLGTNLVDSLLPTVDELRGLNEDFGARAYRVSTVRRTWSGSIAGEGDPADVETEITPVPKVHTWGGFELDLARCGLEELGEIKLTEVSLTYTDAEITGGAIAANEEWLIKVATDHGQASPVRYFQHTRPPFVDREKTIGWVLWLRSV